MTYLEMIQAYYYTPRWLKTMRDVPCAMILSKGRCTHYKFRLVKRVGAYLQIADYMHTFVVKAENVKFRGVA